MMRIEGVRSVMIGSAGRPTAIANPRPCRELPVAFDPHDDCPGAEQGEYGGDRAPENVEPALQTAPDSTRMRYQLRINHSCDVIVPHSGHRSGVARKSYPHL